MGNKSECPACKSYGSDIYSAIHYNYNDCPFCGCPHETLVRWEEMQETIEECKENIQRKEMQKKIDDLFCENAKLKAKIKKMEDLVSFRDVLEPIIKVIEILEND